MLREGRAADADAAVRLLNAVYPHWPASEANFRHRMSTMPARAHSRVWAAEDDGVVVGWADARMNTSGERSDVGKIDVIVDPERRGRGIGSLLYDAGETHLLRLGAKRLLTASPDAASSRRFLEQRGFRHTMTEKVSRLDVQAADTGSFETLRTEKAREGFEVVRLAAFRERPREIYELDLEVTADVPADEPSTDVPFDEWLQRSWREPDLSWEGSPVVVDLEQRPVSFAAMIVLPERRIAWNGMTGTLRAFRGRRLARLAKLASIAWAAERGITEILTGNDETNAPMLAINHSLGYRPFLTELSYVRDIE